MTAMTPVRSAVTEVSTQRRQRPPGSRGRLCRPKNASRSSGRIRIEFTIQTCGSSPLSQSRYTVALHTPMCSATSATLSSRSRPPQRTRKSPSVGTTLARCRVLACLAVADSAPSSARAACADSGTKWVPKLFVKPVDNSDSLDCGLMSVCNESAGLVPLASPCDGSGPDSGPKGRRFKSSRPDNSKSA